MTNPPRRVHCLACLRPQRACICRWIATVANKIDVLILQHPAEVHQAKGTARLLHLSLGSSRLEIGETFSEEQLHSFLHGPIGAPVNAVLLYPPSLGMAAPPALNVDWTAQPECLRLVVLDATWRKSLKMLYRNPVLQMLPRLTLDEAPPSAYRIRKAQHAHQLSTLEATCYALARLEQDEQRYRPLLEGFDGFMAQQLSFRDNL